MTRHFHATALVVIGVIGLFFLSLALHKAPHFSMPHLASNTVSTTPTPVPQTAFLFADNPGSYLTISSLTLETGLKTGIYGAPASPDTSYSTFYLYAGQIYLDGPKAAGLVSLGSHFFYPIPFEQVPFSVSPSHTKALFFSSVTDPKSKIVANHFSLQTTTATISASLAYPDVIGNTPQPLCWSQDESNIVFTNPQKALFFYNLSRQAATPASLSAAVAQYTNVYCNSADNSLYFATAKGIYKQKFAQSNPTQLLASPGVLSQKPVFSSDQPDTILIATNSALTQVNLANNDSKTLYTATDSATLVPYLWQDGAIVYTQENSLPESGQYYLAGKVLDTTKQVNTVFARHQSSNPSSLGTISPIDWIESK